MDEAEAADEPHERCPLSVDTQALLEKSASFLQGELLSRANRRCLLATSALLKKSRRPSWRALGLKFIEF